MIQIFMFMYHRSKTMRKVQMSMKSTEEEYKYEKTNPFHKILRWIQWDIRMCS